MGAELRNIETVAASQRLVICGSMTFYGYMIRTRDELTAYGVQTVLPEPENHLAESLSDHHFEDVRRDLAFAHVRKIRNPRTFGILVSNFEKHGLSNYIGPSTFAEIAIAAAHGKRIFLLNEFPPVYAEELEMWRAVPLRGRLNVLVTLYRDACLRPVRQLSMFAA
jgi:hypothetical protein